MQEVRLDVSAYDELQRRILTKSERISALETELSKQKADHEQEIEMLVKEGKVRVIEKPYSVMEMLITRKRPKKEYKGFDDVKAEVEEHFKQGMFDEELEKQREKLLASIHDKMVEKDSTIESLKSEIEKLKNRSLWERIRNK